MTNIRLAIFLLALLLASAAQAGGLYVSEFGTVDMAAAGSGALVRAGDASTALSNAAGMTYLDSHQLNMGAAPGFGVVRFDQDSGSPNAASNNGGDQGGFIPLVSSSYVHKISDRFRAGLGIISISGASLDPKSDWAGRAHLRRLDLFTITFLPTVAMRVTDWLSVGAGPAITYGTLDWKFAVGPNDVKLNNLDDWAVAAHVGVMVEPSENLRVGFVYQSETDLSLSGRAKGSGPLPSGGAKVDLPLAHAYRMDARWQATNDLALSFGGAFEQWDTLENTNFDLGPATATIPLRFKNTWKLRGGVHYRLNEDWMLQTGLSYDSSALNTSDRIAALPIDEQWRWGIGGVYRWSESTNLGFGFQYLNLGDGNLDNAVIKGNYKNNDFFFFMVNLNFAKLPWDGMATF